MINDTDSNEEKSKPKNTEDRIGVIVSAFCDITNDIWGQNDSIEGLYEYYPDSWKEEGEKHYHQSEIYKDASNLADKVRYLMDYVRVVLRGEDTKEYLTKGMKRLFGAEV